MISQLRYRSAFAIVIMISQLRYRSAFAIAITGSQLQSPFPLSNCDYEPFPFRNCDHVIAIAIPFLLCNCSPLSPFRLQLQSCALPH
ncbi:hypothetical protein EJ08DRAFT_644367 [Tothia fuscella]|uniref:Uncharacterized protein n=1 Tax=Tothia fuscella TaxID=1048955 RepID=A0A9P4U3D1_9PEZI|nr:hypothetical protein EJ08DRAFT_644367 [Tothia fuscella]